MTASCSDVLSSLSRFSSTRTTSFTSSFLALAALAQKSSCLRAMPDDLSSCAKEAVISKVILRVAEP